MYHLSPYPTLQLFVIWPPLTAAANGGRGATDEVSGMQGAVLMVDKA
jgi:hypothetical protein